MLARALRRPVATLLCARATPLALLHGTARRRADDAADAVQLAGRPVAVPGSFEHHRLPDVGTEGGDASRRAFVYFMVGAGGVAAASAAKSAVVGAIQTFAPSADVLAAASVEIDLSKLAEGSNMMVKWRGKPLVIRHRTPEEIKEAKEVDLSTLRDPIKDDKLHKRGKAQYIVLLNICPHLGCVPIPNAGDHYYFCPCHGSHFDMSGRIRAGPSPTNMEVPPYRFIDEHTIVVG